MWISAFLSHRMQCVVVENTFSSWSAVVSGVPQGSVLGPVLFVVFINDIVGSIGTLASANLFADDVKLYSRINDTIEASVLQRVLDEIVDWADYWQLSININKCNVLHLGSGNLLIDYYNIVI